MDVLDHLMEDYHSTGFWMATGQRLILRIN